MNAIIGIGRNVGNEPMDYERWRNFRISIRSVVERNGGKMIADVVGQSYSEGWGFEEAAWFAFDASNLNLGQLRQDLSALADQYGQDAIALTVGATDLVERQRVAA